MIKDKIITKQIFLFGLQNQELCLRERKIIPVNIMSTGDYLINVCDWTDEADVNRNGETLVTDFFYSPKIERFMEEIISKHFLILCMQYKFILSQTPVLMQYKL